MRFLIFGLCLLPLCYWIYAAVFETLGTDPAKALVIATGHWTFYFLLITLSLSPLRTVWPQLRRVIQYRRLLGLYTLFYAVLHALAFWAFILNFNVGRLSYELTQRTYILLTLPALVMLIIMGATSTQAMMKRLGKRWLPLHRSIYGVALLAWLHVFFQVRASYQDALIFGLATAFLLGFRMIHSMIRRKRK